jgi:membrane protein CcdC involved in cytochrome C biogenesis
MEFVSITHPQPLKNDVIVGDTFGVFFQVQMIWHKLFRVKRRLEMPMKKTKNFICVEMLEEGYKFF